MGYNLAEADYKMKGSEKDLDPFLYSFPGHLRLIS